ncbi:MAG TPA: hypothetical protein VLS27_01865 [Gammaproteobacteria bacterium]|nr:hypothetical protein [Gammaproteobacteria bacterium]
MKILLILEVRRGAGALAGVAEALNARGFYVDEHKLIPRDDETAEIRVLATGEGDLARLRGDVGAVSAVIGLVEMREASRAETPAPPETPSEHPPDPWVERLVGAWPDVLPVLKEFAAPLSVADCEHKLTCLGVDAGAVIYGRSARPYPPSSVEAGLKQIVEPALRDFAKTRVKGKTLRVLETDLASSEQVDLLFLPVEDTSYCCFISGLVAGLLNATPGMPRVRVEETRCLGRGDHVCDFKVTEIG